MGNHEDGPDSHLLPGYRFCPLEEELILNYLCPKVKGEEVPGEDYLIFNYDLYGTEPWEIWNMYKERRKRDVRFSQDLYFFTQRKKKTVNASRKSRTVRSGTWKAVGGEDVRDGGGTVVGNMKRFRYDNKESDEHGGWIMLEYELDRSQADMLDEQEVQKYVICKLRKNKVSKKKGKREVDEDDREKLATGDDDDVPDDLALDEFKNVKQEEYSEIEQGEEEQGMHATGGYVCDAGSSLSSEQDEAENCWKQYLNPIIFVDDDNAEPPYDALEWEEENYLTTQSFVTCFEFNENVQPFPVADHELQRKAENCEKQCLEHRPFTADCETMIEMLGQESYLSKQCPVQCVYCDYVQPFASDIYMSREEHPLRRVTEQEHQGSKTSKAKHNSSMVSTSTTSRKPDMIALKSSSTGHHRAEDNRGSNDFNEGQLGAGTKGLDMNVLGYHLFQRSCNVRLHQKLRKLRFKQ